MTNEQNFKKGDNVRYIGKYPCYVRTDISKDETYTVREIDGDMCLVDVPSEGAISVDDLELVEPYDRRTAFLRRLGALLREFDAKIFGGLSDIYDEDVLYIQIGVDKIAYCNGELNVCYPHINADNIMGFDKE